MCLREQRQGRRMPVPGVKSRGRMFRAAGKRRRYAKGKRPGCSPYAQETDATAPPKVSRHPET